MVKLEIFVMVIFALYLIPVTQAFQPTYSCADSNTLEVLLVINDSGNYSRISQDSIPCPYGCVEGIGRYGADCLNPPQAMPMEFYLLIMGLSGALLFIGVARKRWFACMASTVLFLYIAFQSFNITIMSQAYYLPQLVVLAWAASIFGTMFTVVGAVQYIRVVFQEKEKKRKEREARPGDIKI
jgi:hypothetical protein